MLQHGKSSFFKHFLLKFLQKSFRNLVEVFKNNNFQNQICISASLHFANPILGLEMQNDHIFQLLNIIDDYMDRKQIILIKNHSIAQNVLSEQDFGPPQYSKILVLNVYFSRKIHVSYRIFISTSHMTMIF